MPIDDLEAQQKITLHPTPPLLPTSDFDFVFHVHSTHTPQRAQRLGHSTASPGGRRLLDAGSKFVAAPLASGIFQLNTEAAHIIVQVGGICARHLTCCKVLCTSHVVLLVINNSCKKVV